VIDPTEKSRRLLDALAGIARDAGRAILEVYGTEFTVTLKDDRSPLTDADKQLARQYLASVDPFA